MGFVRNKIVQRLPGGTAVGRLTDIAIVGNAGLRWANRRGWVSDEMAERFGASTSSGGTGLSAKELALVALAAMRLVSRVRKRR